MNKAENSALCGSIGVVPIIGVIVLTLVSCNRQSPSAAQMPSGLEGAIKNTIAQYDLTLAKANERDTKYNNYLRARCKEALTRLRIIEQTKDVTPALTMARVSRLKNESNAVAIEIVWIASEPVMRGITLCDASSNKTVFDNVLNQAPDSNSWSNMSLRHDTWIYVSFESAEAALALSIKYHKPAVVARVNQVESWNSISLFGENGCQTDAIDLFKVEE